MRKFSILFFGSLLSAFFMTAGGGHTQMQREAAERTRTQVPASLKTSIDFGRVPLYFIANQGQTGKEVAYYVQGQDKALYFTSGGVTFVLNKPNKNEEDRSALQTESPGRANPSRSNAEAHGGRLDRDELIESRVSERWVLKLDFVGANPEVKPSGKDKTRAVISYFKGNPEEWHTGLPTYSQLVYPNLWPGIDLVYSGTSNKLKYEFIVRPGADPSNIRLAYRGASSVGVNEAGRLRVVTPVGSFEDDIPVGWQEVDGRRVDVALRYALKIEKTGGAAASGENDCSTESPSSETFVYGFDVGDYDRSKPLILDPAVLVYCGYVGGSESEEGHGIAIDGSGNSYITGYTYSTEDTFPVTVGPYQTYTSGGDAFVAKINASGTGFVYCGYIGGSSVEGGEDIAVDTSGNAYIIGNTWSSDLPVIAGPDPTKNANQDAFVAKVNSAGTALSYCGYIGGSGNDYGYGIAVNSLGCAFVTGMTYSDETSFPATWGPDITYNEGGDAFVGMLVPAGTAFNYCSYIGGSNLDAGSAIAVDASSNAYVTGTTMSTEATFPEKVGPGLTHSGNRDVFVAKVDSDGESFNYCGYIGGSNNEYASGIAVDASRNAYITGWTLSTQVTFPETVGPDLTHNGEDDAFVAKVNLTGAALVYCGYIGGSSDDFGYGIAVDASGNAYVAGYTGSTQVTFPVTVGPDLTHNGLNDAFVAKVNSAGTALSYCGYIGGTEQDYGYDIAVELSGCAYITGYACSTEATFPVVGGPELTFNGGTQDAFVAKIVVKDDFLGTWDGQGVYYRNTETGKWVKLASPANLIAAGDLGGDNIDDLITIFPGTPGIWTRSSSTGTWTKLSYATPKHISSGDINGDGRVDLLVTWEDGIGVYYRNSVSGLWTKIAQPANLLASGDLDGDGKDDPIIVFPTPAGVWVKYSKTATWAKLSSTSARDIASGDMNGDGRDDLLGTWDGTGVFYRNSVSGVWAKMAELADQVTAGDTDGDGIDDLITSSAAGVYIKSSKTGKWTKLANPVKDMVAGLIGGGIWGSGAFGFTLLDMPAGGYAEDPVLLFVYEDLSEQGPGGWRFAAQEEENLLPLETREMLSLPGPGDPGFAWIEQDNLFPQEQEKAAPERRQKAERKKAKRSQAR